MSIFLDKLYQVRSLREQLAQSDLARSRQRFEQADKELSNKQMQLKKHCLLQSKVEAYLFEKINRKEVNLTEFKTYRGRISELRTEGKKCGEKVRQAEIQKNSACVEVDHLSAVFQKRCRENTKLKEYRDAWNIRIQEEKHRSMEEEMEEMVMNRFSHNDADS